ncbi:tubulin-like doman-containing protein [uncultured Thiodictyon sp.]|uniref:tubulin-like doman-containing protein n=1 Tax=uncultured Thiodictyon sp. TaxID=1846217 RepID=UPI0025CDA2EB|nr:tubulin-like doman-containing protein [uncultured Thiodictyon sp.]
MRNHLFIGLGGQGGRTLGELRKVMEQRAKDTAILRRQGVGTAFLAIDSSNDVQNHRRSWTVFGTDLALDPREWLILKRPGAATIGGLALRPDIAPWIGDKARVEGFLSQQNIEGEGANQLRRFGRLLFAEKANTVRDAVIQKVNALNTIGQFQCAFHLFATLAGGTGSGGLIDLVTLIRTKYPGSGANQFPIYVYVYVTDADEQGANIGYFFQNQFTGLRDLNALICGRLRPHLLGDGMNGAQFSGVEPINQATITAPFNSAGHKVLLDTQIRIVAEACFERIVAWSSGQLSPAGQASLTGQDTLATFPAEPSGRPERSYRFSALGMRRWEVPTEQIKTLLALDLLASALRQMIFNHWRETSGYVDLLPDSSSAATAGVVAILLAAIEDQRRPVPRVEDLTQRLRTALAQLAAGRARAPGAVPPTLQDIERAFRQFYLSQFEQGGVDALIRQRRGDQPGRVAEAVRRIEAILTGLWWNQPLALACIPQVLAELGAQLRRDGEEPPVADQASGDRLQRIIEARRMEWDKLTWLSAGLTGRRKALITAHANDCGGVHEADLRRRLAELDREFVRELADRLPQVQTRFLSVQQDLMGLLQTVVQDRDQIDQELRALAQNVTANRYEFDPAALDTFLTWMRCHKHHQQTAAALMRAEVVTVIGSQQTLASMSNTRDALTTIEDALRPLARQQAEQIHLDYAANGQGQPILEDSVLDILQGRYTANRPAFLAELQVFLGQAAVALLLRNDIQPMQLLGAGTGVPHMPRRLLVIGLPRHPFGPTLEQEFIRALPAGDNRLLEVFDHDDPGQIRLLTIDYWLAARFATVVKALGDRYQETTQGARNPDTIYFCNIDPPGEQGLRPDVFLPDDATLRLRYAAELWLGQHSDIGAVLVDEHGVFLIYEDTDGRHAEPLGLTLEDAIAGPDYGKMFMLHARLGQALAGIGRQRLADMLNQQRLEMDKQHGLTSPEYQRWDRMLTLLKPLAD